MNTDATSEKRQGYLILICWLIYTVAQLGRYTYSSNVNLIMEKYSVNHTEAGLAATLFFMMYGLGQIINGFVCDKYNVKFVLTFVMIFSGLINFAIYLDIAFVYIKYLWALNGLLQATLWSSLILTLKRGISEKKLKTAAFIMSTAASGGTFLSYVVCALFSLTPKFEYSFLLAGILLPTVGLLWFITLKGNSATRPQNEKENSNFKRQEVEDEKRAIPRRQYGILLLLFSVFIIFAYAISGGMRSWMPSILKETYALEDWLSIFLSLFLPFCTIFNAAISQYLYAKTNDFVKVCGIGFLAGSLFLIPVIFFLKTSWVIMLILFILITMSMGCISNAMTVQVPLYMGGKGKSGFLAGWLNGLCYLGSALSTYGLGWIADNMEWNTVFVIFFIFSILCFIIALIYNVYKI